MPALISQATTIGQALESRIRSGVTGTLSLAHRFFACPFVIHLGVLSEGLEGALIVRLIPVLVLIYLLYSRYAPVYHIEAVMSIGLT